MEKKTETSLCQLCGKTGSLKYILSSCQTALADGRYRWRHDQILKDIAEAVAAAIHTNIPSNDRSTIEFVKAGVKAKPKKKLTQKSVIMSNRLASKGRLREKPYRILD